MPKKPSRKLPPLSPSKQQHLAEVIHACICRFSGQMDELESAIGFVYVGHYVGWKVLYLIHSKKTVRKYEILLGIVAREEFPEEGPMAKDTNAWKIAQGISNFWKLVSGDVKPTLDLDRRQVE